MFDKKTTQLRHHFGIHDLSDWQTIRPAQIISQDGVGPVLLDHLRLYLASKGVTLKDDETPDYWMKHAKTSRITKTLSYQDCNVLVPFTILIDSMEQLPFTFDGIGVDATDTPTDLAEMVKIGEIDQEDIKLEIRKRFKSLGVGKGDYSIQGFAGQCNVERKSMEDAHGTILGWGDRRKRFTRELENLAAMDCSAVVVECSFGQLLSEAPARGKKTAKENRKILHRQVLSWQQQYRVPWVFCDSRRLAEVTTFRIMQRYYKKQIKPSKPMVVSMDRVNEMLAKL